MTFYKTTDGGKNWTTHEMTSTDGNAYALAINPENENIIYVGGYYEGSATGGNDISPQSSGGLFKSIDGGKNWTKIAGMIQSYIYDIVVDLVTPSTVYVGTSGGVYKSMDSGSTWIKPKASFDVSCLRIHPSFPQKVFAGGEDGVYFSDDGGSNWAEINKGLFIKDVDCLDINAASSELFAGTNGGSIYKINTKLLIEPKAPKKLKAKAKSWSQIKLRWKDKSKNEDGFKIERRKGTKGNWTEIAVTNANVKAYLDQDLEENTLYKYQVQAFNSIGPSPYSNTAKAKTKKK